MAFSNFGFRILLWPQNTFDPWKRKSLSYYSWKGEEALGLECGQIFVELDPLPTSSFWSVFVLLHLSQHFLSCQSVRGSLLRLAIYSVLRMFARLTAGVTSALEIVAFYWASSLRVGMETMSNIRLFLMSPPADLPPYSIPKCAYAFWRFSCSSSDNTKLMCLLKKRKELWRSRCSLGGHKAPFRKQKEICHQRSKLCRARNGNLFSGNWKEMRV